MKGDLARPRATVGDGALCGRPAAPGPSNDAAPEAPVELAGLRRAFLAARDERQARLDAFLARADGAACVVAITTSIPGPDKTPDGAELLIEAAVELLHTMGWLLPARNSEASRGGGLVDVDALVAEDRDWFEPDPSDLEGRARVATARPVLHDRGEDALGEFMFLALDVDARRVKRECVRLESGTPWGRLLDLDVYDGDGRPVSRPDVGLPPRECLLCEEPARDCMRLGRHTEADLQARVEVALRFLKPCLIER